MTKMSFITKIVLENGFINSYYGCQLVNSVKATKEVITNMEQINYTPTCCNQPMTPLNLPQGSFDWVNILATFICPNCGKLTTIREDLLDDEELLDEFEDVEEVKQMPFYRELLSKQESDE